MLFEIEQKISRGLPPTLDFAITFLSRAPPPARRSTRREDRRHRRHGRLLRPRGDRPLASARHDIAGGSSARAEIDPGIAIPADRPSRLLRPRGDRPAPRCVMLGERGSSARAEIDPRRPAMLWQRSGSSARAEIDPSARDAFELVEAPPPARRSTRAAVNCGASTRGSSARAEIDPRRLVPQSRESIRLLRPRGDRPRSARRHRRHVGLLRPRGDRPSRRSAR